MNILNKIFGKLHYWRRIYNFRIVSTLFFNFRMLPFHQAIHLPFIFYGKVEFWTLKGRVELQAPCHFGMVKWGVKRDGFSPSGIPSCLSLAEGASWVVRGDVDICPGCTFRIIGTLSLCDKCMIGSHNIIACNNYIFIGVNSRISFNSVITDTNFHYTSVDGQVVSKEGSVYIGDYCWIGNNSSIMKGAYIPSGSIVTSRSLINKDFEVEGENLMLAGAPAKVKRTGVKRIFDAILEGKIQRYFAENPDEKSYSLSDSEKNTH